MAEIKTKQTNINVEDFINAVSDENKKKDALILLKLFKEITNEPAKMWGPTIIGFGKYHYKSERSSQEGDWPLTGFSPRKSALTLYVFSGAANHVELLSKLGKHKTGVGCLYINKLADVDMDVLEKLIRTSYVHMKKLHKIY